MHMAWMRTVGGRLKSDYSYSPAIYNSFPWPDMTDAQATSIAGLAQAVLDARDAFPGSTLEVLYDPDSMPPALRRAHATLDREVDRLYRRTTFAFERQRVEYLLKLYEKEASPLALGSKPKSGRKRPVIP